MKNHLTKELCTVFVAIACLCFCVTALAQEEIVATIVGQVTDSTGLVIPNVTIVVKNKDTGVERTVQSNKEGNYNVTPLIPGDYTLTVEHQGFKKYIVNVTLNVRDRRPINIALEPGLATETVTITDEPPLIQEGPTGQTLISGKQVLEIPLNNRDFLKLTELVPGVSSDLADETSLGLLSRTSISINGMRRNGVNYFVDGVNNTDGGSNITLLSTPTIDSIKEFKVLSSNYTAELGRSGSGAVTIVTKGGSNEFRGSAYEFLRNDVFNANTFFNNRRGRLPNGNLVGERPRLRYNTFGYTFSGPVVFPKSDANGDAWWTGKNKTFFFFSQDFRRIRRATTTTLVTVPTAAQRAGDFSSSLGAPLYWTSATSTTYNTTVTAFPVTVTDTNGQAIQARAGMIFNPANQAYAGNIIPVNDQNQIALRFLNIWPGPNSGTNQFSYNATALQNSQQEVIRIDHNFNQNHRLFGRYTHDLNVTQEPGGLFNGILLPDISTTDTRVPGHIFALSFSSILSSNVVNEVTYNFSQNFIASNLVGKGRLSDYNVSYGAGLGQAFPENNNNAIPSLSIPGITFAGSMQGFKIRYRSQVFRDIMTVTKGSHTLKFGVEWAFEGKNENSNNATQGSFAFSELQTRGSAVAPTGATVSLGTAGRTTGIGLASYLVGRANSYTESEFDISFRLHLGRREFFVQDTWRVRPNVTLDLGVRYQYFVPATDRGGVLSSFNPGLYSLANAPTCANATCTSLIRGTGNALNGIGVANSTSPFGETIVPSDKNNFSPRVGLAWSPNFKSGLGRWLFGEIGKTSVRLGYGLYYDQIATFLYQDPTAPNRPFSNSATYTSGATTVTFADPTAGALGNLPISALGGIDPNLQTPIIQQWSFGVQREIFKNAVIDLSYVGTKGDHLLRRRDINFVQPSQFFGTQPAGCTSGSTACINLLRPFRGYGAINFLETEAISRYHGMLSSFSYRFAKGNTITLSYTFSKNLTDFTNDRDAVDSPQNPFNMRIEYAEARTSRPHIFSASYVYEIPFFKKSPNWFLRNVVAGWQVSGITNIESGPPISRVLAFSNNAGLRGNRSQLVSDPIGGLTGTVDPTGLPYWFDPNAFADPANGTFGNSGRAILRLPGRNQTNFAISRYFYISREKSRYIQFRWETFNAFNHTQFLGVNNQIGQTTSGRVTSTRLPREMQFGLKFIF